MKFGAAVALALCGAGFLAIDALVFDGELFLSLARRFVGLLRWMAFWR